jgi:hypothetical protein
MCYSLIHGNHNACYNGFRCAVDGDIGGDLSGDFNTVFGSVQGMLCGNHNTIKGNVRGDISGHFNTIEGGCYGKISGCYNTIGQLSYKWTDTITAQKPPRTASRINHGDEITITHGQNPHHLTPSTFSPLSLERNRPIPYASPPLLGTNHYIPSASPPLEANRPIPSALPPPPLETNYTILSALPPPLFPPLKINEEEKTKIPTHEEQEIANENVEIL